LVSEKEVKSVNAPRPKNMSNGNNSLSNPAFFRMPNSPSSSNKPESGKLARSTPVPIGNKRRGS